MSIEYNLHTTYVKDYVTFLLYVCIIWVPNVFSIKLVKAVSKVNKNGHTKYY